MLTDGVRDMQISRSFAPRLALRIVKLIAERRVVMNLAKGFVPCLRHDDLEVWLRETKKILSSKWRLGTLTQNLHPTGFNMRTPKEVGLKLSKRCQTSSNMAARAWSPISRCPLSPGALQPHSTVYLYADTTVCNFRFFNVCQVDLVQHKNLSFIVHIVYNRTKSGGCIILKWISEK
jgi:hypothetical protein